MNLFFILIIVVRKNVFYKILIILIILIITTTVIFIFRLNLKKYISGYVYGLVEANIVNVLNTSTTDAINKYKEVYNEFVSIKENDEKEIKLLNINMLYINCLQRDVASLSLEYLTDYCGTQEISIPSGVFIGGMILAGRGRHIKIKLIPIGATDVQYRTEFESVAVNSTKFSIYIDVNAHCKISVPFYVEEVYSSTSILIVESIIQGEVPPYIMS